jgi:hypothetical protein
MKSPPRATALSCVPLSNLDMALKSQRITQKAKAKEIEKADRKKKQKR